MQENTQPAEKLEYRQDGMLEVHSTFDTIQGEGPFAGVPATFIRLSGCNLECTLCDTEYTSIRTKFTPEDLVCELNKLPKRDLVVLTGGEPLRQNITPAVDAIISSGRKVQVETNGTLHLDSLSKYVNTRGMFYIVCSPKTPSINNGIIPLIQAFKYVVEAGSIDESDGLPLTSVGPQYGKPARPPKDWLATPNNEVYVQPLDLQDDYYNKTNMEAAVKSCMTYGYRLSIQTHKICGLP